MENRYSWIEPFIADPVGALPFVTPELPGIGGGIKATPGHFVVKEIPFEKRTWFIGEVVAAGKREGHLGTEALMCGRHDYLLPGEIVAHR